MARIALILIAFTLGACWEVGGANTQQSQPGNSDGGNIIGLQLIISRDGRHLIAAGPERDPSGPERAGTGGDRGVYSVDLQTFASVELELALDARRMAFAADDSAYFLTRLVGPTGFGDHGLVEQVSLTTGRRLGSWPVPVGSASLTYDERSDRIALWSLFRNDLHVLDPRSGTLRSFDLGRNLVDARWLPSGELGVVLATEFKGDLPTAEVVLFSPTWRQRRFEVPNCASRLVVSPVTDLALMAPMECIKDPVSVIDLGRAAFVENLPGFGPVAFSPNGRTVVAFGRQADLALFGIKTGTPFSLLFIELDNRSPGRAALTIDTLDIGDALPIYQVTPDGQVVLVYSVFDTASYDGIYLIDVATRSIRETSGPELPLDEFVITPDSRLVYLVQGGLYRLDLDTGRIVFIRLECGGIGEPAHCNPELINMLPGGDTLVLGWHFQPEYALFDIAHEVVTRTFVVGDRPDASELVDPIGD